MEPQSQYAIWCCFLSMISALSIQASTIELGWATAPSMPFSSGPVEFDVANALAVTLDGTIVLVGTHDPSGPVPSEFAALQLIPNMSGGVDLGWATAISGPFGPSEDDAASSVAIDLSGNFILAGFHTTTGSKDQFAALQLISTGIGVALGWATSLLEPFGTSTVNLVSDIAIDSSGDIILAGRHDPFPGTISRFAALQLTPTGSTVSLGWVTAPIEPFGPVDPGGDRASSVAIDANETIILAGSHNPSGSAPGRFAALQLIPNLSGGVDLGWATSIDEPFGPSSSDSASSMIIDGEGNLILAGSHSPSGGSSRFAALQLIPNGTGVLLGWSIAPVAPFGPTLFAAANDVTIDAQGNIILAGLHSPSGGFQPQFAALQLIPNSLGGVELGWATAVSGPFGPSPFDQANGVAIGADGSPILAGFHAPSGPEPFRFAALQLIQIPPPPSISPIFELPFIPFAAA